jgi:hypothetical protein
LVAGVSIFRQIKFGKKRLKVFLQSSRVLGAIPGDNIRSNPEKSNFGKDLKTQLQCYQRSPGLVITKASYSN